MKNYSIFVAPSMDQLQSSSRANLESIKMIWTRAAQRQELAFATIAIAFLLAVFFYKSRQKGRKRMPPGPRPWPIIGNLGLLSPLAHQDFQKLARKYGPIFHLSLGSNDAIVVSSPKIAEEILKTNDIAFAARPSLMLFQIMGYSGKVLVSLPYGPYFRHIKAVFTDELLSNKRIHHFQDIRKDEVLSIVWSTFDEYKEGKPVSLNLKLYHLLMNIITRMVMNKAYFGPSSSAIDTREATEMVDSLEQMNRLTGAFVLGDYIPIFKLFDVQGLKRQMRATSKQSDKFFQRILDDHRQKHGSKQDKENMDLIDVLLTRSTGKDENPLTDDEIKAFLLMAMIGGTETADISVVWAMTELLKHPNVLQKAQAELDAVVGRDRLVEEVDIPHLKYLHLIVKETFRLHPPAPMLVPHKCVESREIAGYRIPVNSQVFINTYAIQRDPEVWDRPLEFDPERFLSTNTDVHGHDFELLPFGAGRRSCPGKNLGLLMVGYILAVFLQACNWCLPPGISPEDVDSEEAPGLVCAKKNPLEAIGSPRLPMDIIFRNRKPPPKF